MLILTSSKRVPSYMKANKDCVDGRSESHDICVVNNLTKLPITFESLRELQSRDRDIRRIYESAKQGNAKKNFSIKKGLVVYECSRNGKYKIYLPEAALEMIYKYYHEDIGGLHLGTYKCLKKVTENFYHPRLSKYFRERIQRCEECGMNKPAQVKVQGPLHSTYSERPMQRLYTDLMGPITKSVSGNTYLMIVVDHYTKYVWLNAIRNSTSQNIINVFKNNVFKNFGLPQEIISDNASYYSSHDFKNFLFDLGITHKTIAPYAPQANLAERYFRNIKSVFKIYYSGDQNNKWDKNLSEIQQGFNSAQSESTKYCPNELMLGYKVNCPLTNVWGLRDLEEKTFHAGDAASKLREALANNQRRNRRNQRLQFYAGDNAERFKIGNWVWVKDLRPLTGKLLRPRFVGPYQIIFHLTDMSCILQHKEEKLDVRRAHMSQLKPCFVNTHTRTQK